MFRAGPLTPAAAAELNRLRDLLRQNPPVVRAAPPIYVTRGPSETLLSFQSSAAAASGQLTMLVPLAKIEVAPPASGCDTLDDCVDQCWGPYYWCKILTRTDDQCGAWECGGCAYLTVVDGLPIPLDVPIPGWSLGSPPSDIQTAGLPLDFPCSESDLAGATLYGVYAGHLSYAAVPDENQGWCADPLSGGYIQVWTCDVQVWLDCSGWTTVGSGYMADVKGCATLPNVRRVVHFSRMVRGDEFEVDGEPRACSPLFVYDRPKAYDYRLEQTGDGYQFYGPNADDPCGDDEELLADLPCCDNGGDGGTGGSGCCEATPWGGRVTWFVPGVGYVIGSWSGAAGAYIGSFTHPSCGLTIWLAFIPDTCTCKWTCNPSQALGSWVSLVQPVGFGVTCDPNVAGPYDDLDASGDAVAGDCETNSCTVINDIYVQTYTPP